MNRIDLTVAQVAVIAGCHRNTVLRYDKIGMIYSKRDVNGYRRYSLGEAIKLKEILATRSNEPSSSLGVVK